MNAALVNFIIDSWLFLLVFLLVIIPIFPTTWVGIDASYKDQFGVDKKRLKVSILTAIFQLILQPITQAVIGLLVILSFKATVSILIFVVIGVELYFRKQVSEQVVSLVAISVVVLYLEQLIEKGQKFSIWKIFEWEKDRAK